MKKIHLLASHHHPLPDFAMLNKNWIMAASKIISQSSVLFIHFIIANLSKKSAIARHSPQNIKNLEILLCPSRKSAQKNINHVRAQLPRLFDRFEATFFKEGLTFYLLRILSLCFKEVFFWIWIFRRRQVDGWLFKLVVITYAKVSPSTFTTNVWGDK